MIASGRRFSCVSIPRKLVNGYDRLQVKSLVANCYYRLFCSSSDAISSSVIINKKKSARKVKKSVSHVLTNDKNLSAALPKSSRRKLVPVADLSLESATAELKNLNSDINIHDDLYYNQGKPSITDREYDKLLQRASVIIGRFNKLSSLIDHFSRVGAGNASSTSEAGSSFVHSSPMLSLENAFSAVTLSKALEKMESENISSSGFVIEPKIDGLSLAVIYKNGKLHRAGTRGDGNVGEDMTRAVKKYIHQIPHKLAGNKAHGFEVVEVRGEVFIGRKDFIQMNRIRSDQNLTVFSTARNAAAGSLRKLNILRKKKKSSQEDRDSNAVADVDVDSDENYSRLLNFFAYSLQTQPQSVGNVEPPRGLQTESTQWNVLEVLHDMGFQIAKPNKLIEGVERKEVIKEVIESCAAFEATKDAWAFDADGAVVKVNSLAEQNRLGVSRTAPKWAIAYKFNTEVVETTLEEIVVQVGRTGFLTPVAKLTPVTISGVTVGKATLHNEHEVRRLGLYPGCKVRVVRAGDVIPRVVGLASSDQAPAEVLPWFELPSHCPVCGSVTARDPLIARKAKRSISSGEEALLSTSPSPSPAGDDCSEESVGVRCTGGFTCSAQAIEQLRHFCSRDAMDIVGLSSSKIADLYEGGFVKTAADLYLLRTHDLTALPSLKDSSNASSFSNPAVADDDSAAAESIESLRKRKSWGDTSVNNLLAAIDLSRNEVPMHRLLHALGIRGIGIQNAKDISKLYSGNFFKFWHDLKTATASLTDEEAIQLARTNLKVNSRKKDPKQDSNAINTTTTTTASLERNWGEEFAFLQSASEKITTSLFAFARNQQSVEIVDSLLEHVNIVGDFSTQDSRPTVVEVANDERSEGKVVSTTLPEDKSLPLKGRVILFTGKAKFSRAELMKRCEQLGATCVSTTNKLVNLLIDCHDSSGPLSAKRKKAMDKGMEVWNEEQLLSMINMH